MVLAPGARRDRTHAGVSAAPVTAGSPGSESDVAGSATALMTKPSTRHCPRDSALFDCLALLAERGVYRSSRAVRVRRSKRIAIKLGGLNCGAGQVDKDAPEIAALRELSANRCEITPKMYFTIRVTHLGAPAGSNRQATSQSRVRWQRCRCGLSRRVWQRVQQVTVVCARQDHGGDPQRAPGHRAARTTTPPRRPTG